MGRPNQPRKNKSDKIVPKCCITSNILNVGERVVVIMLLDIQHSLIKLAERVVFPLKSCI